MDHDVLKAMYPRLKTVEPIAEKKLRVTFANETVKIYACAPLLDEEPFRLLKDEAFFKAVHVEPNGYAVVWDDQVDLAESELRVHGERSKHGSRAPRSPRDSS